MFPLNDSKNRDQNNNDAINKSNDIKSNNDLQKRNTPKVLTGTISMVLKWNKLIDGFVYFEIFGFLINEIKFTNNEIFTLLIQDKKGPILQVLYSKYFDLQLEKFTVGKMLRCFGHMTDNNKFQAYKIRNATNDEIDSVTRLTLISNKIVSKITKKNL